MAIVSITNRKLSPLAIPTTPSKKAAEAALAGSMPPSVILLPGDNKVVESKDKIPLDEKTRMPSLGYVVSSDWEAAKTNPVCKAYMESKDIVEVT